MLRDDIKTKGLKMAYVAADRDEREFITSKKPTRDKDRELSVDFKTEVVELPKGSIKKLIGRELTWEDEPAELVEQVISKDTEIREAINKITKERSKQLDVFVTAILKVREDVGEGIDMNYIALEHGSYIGEDGMYKQTVKVVYIKNQPVELRDA